MTISAIDEKQASQSSDQEPRSRSFEEPTPAPIPSAEPQEPNVLIFEDVSKREHRADLLEDPSSEKYTYRIFLLPFDLEHNEPALEAAIAKLPTTESISHITRGETYNGKTTTFLQSDDLPTFMTWLRSLGVAPDVVTVRVVLAETDSHGRPKPVEVFDVLDLPFPANSTTEIKIATSQVRARQDLGEEGVYSLGDNADDDSTDPEAFLNDR